MKRINIGEALARLRGDVVPVAEEAPPAQPTFEERMAADRKRWREQDSRRYLRPEIRDELWDVDGFAAQLLFAWSDQKARWVMVAERMARTHRRKPMTMNRLFAGFRQRHGLKRDVPLKLISVNEHASILASDPHWFTRPPMRYLSRKSA